MAIVTSGLVAEWVGRLNSYPSYSSSTLSWVDLVGSHDGTLTGFADPMTADSGWVGDGSESTPYGLHIDGATSPYDDIVDCGGAGDWNTPSAISIEAWVLADAHDATVHYPRILDKRDATNGFAVYRATSNDALGVNFTVGGTGYDTASGLGTIGTGLKHVVVTYDDDTNYIYGYINGSSGGAGVSTGGGTINTSTANLCLGNRSSDKLRTWMGALYTVRIYNRALTGSEISQNYAAGVLACTAEAPTLTTTAISAITATTATSGGTITDEGSSAVTDYGVVWATHTDPVVESDSHTHDKP